MKENFILNWKAIKNFFKPIQFPDSSIDRPYICHDPVVMSRPFYTFKFEIAFALLSVQIEWTYFKTIGSCLTIKYKSD